MNETTSDSNGSIEETVVGEVTPVKSPLRRRLIKSALAIGFLGLPSAGYAHYVEPDSIRVAKLEVPLKGWPDSKDGFKIGHISDLHADSERAVKRTQEAVLILESQKPDAVFITGDYITRRARPYMDDCAEALGVLAKSRHGAYAVLGNHDWYAGDADTIAQALKDFGIKVLINESAPLRGIKRVQIVGLGPMSYSAQRPELALANAPNNALKLLLIHEPDFADESPEGFAMQFSGHSHGGQIRIPGLPPVHTPVYARIYKEGLEQGKSHPVYTTRGVGMVGPQFRFCCPPEVSVITLRSAKP